MACVSIGGIIAGVIVGGLVLAGVAWLIAETVEYYSEDADCSDSCSWGDDCCETNCDVSYCDSVGSSDSFFGGIVDFTTDVVDAVVETTTDVFEFIADTTVDFFDAVGEAFGISCDDGADCDTTCTTTCDTAADDCGSVWDFSFDCAW